MFTNTIHELIKTFCKELIIELKKKRTLNYRLHFVSDVMQITPNLWRFWLMATKLETKSLTVAPLAQDQVMNVS